MSQRHRRDERGSVLVLVPAAILVLLILGCIAVDFSVAYLGQRELRYEAAAIVNDAAGEAISDPRFYGTGGGAGGDIVIDATKARLVLEASLSHRQLRGVHDVRADIAVAGNQLCVTLTGRVDYVFARAFPFAAHSTAVVGRSAATAVAGPAGTAVPANRACP